MSSTIDPYTYGNPDWPQVITIRKDERWLGDFSTPSVYAAALVATTVVEKYPDGVRVSVAPGPQTLTTVPLLSHEETMRAIDAQFLPSLSDCVNWETNVLGDCGGRVEPVSGVLVCETCRNRPEEADGAPREQWEVTEPSEVYASDDEPGDYLGGAKR